MDYAQPHLLRPPAIVRAANLDSIRPWREAIEENRRFPHWKARNARFKDYQDAMLKGIVPFVAAYAGLTAAPLIATFGAGAVDATNATNYTFSSVSLGGAANALRWTVVGVAGSFGAALDAVTVNGVATTLIGGGSWGLGSMGIVHNPTGTAEDIFIDGGASNNSGAIVCYSITGLLRATHQDLVSSSAASPTTDTLRVSRGGCLITAGRLSAAAGAVSGGTGLSEDYDTVIESTFRMYGAHVATIGADSTAFDVTVTSAGSTIVRSNVSWAPN